MGFLGAVQYGHIRRDMVITRMNDVLTELLENGWLHDYGEVQTYLRQRGAIVQLVAHPFDPSEFRGAEVRCLDVVSREPRGHQLIVAVGYQEDMHMAQALLHRLGMSDEVNEATLAHDTGVPFVEGFNN